MKTLNTSKTSSVGDLILKIVVPIIAVVLLLFPQFASSYLIRCACTESGSKIPAQNMFSYATATQARPSIWPDLFINFTPLVIMFWQ